jgi:hypothetical protein
MGEDIDTDSVIMVMTYSLSSSVVSTMSEFRVCQMSSYSVNDGRLRRACRGSHALAGR